MHGCKPLRFEDFDRLEESFRFEATLDAPPEKVFEVFEDPDSWPVWARAIRKVTWTSPKPFEVGTTRDVNLIGGLVAHERFFIWDPPHRMAFYFLGTNKPVVSSLGEYYELRAIGDGSTRFVWRIAYEPRSIMKRVSPLLRPLVRLFCGRIVSGLERYVRDMPDRKPSVQSSPEPRAYG